MKKIFFGILFTGLALVSVAAFSQRHALACELLPVLGKRAIADEVFVDIDIAEFRDDPLRDIVDSAASRITRVYGAPLSQPRVFITSDSQAAADWGANETASVHKMPWRSCIIIGPKGQSVDVFAHEWLHAEIQHRVGFWRHLTEVPIWFDEGAALTVDYREPFVLSRIKLPEQDVVGVKRFETGRDFFSGGRKNYQAARLAVEPLIQSERFFDDLQRIAEGAPFNAVFLSPQDR